MQLRLLPGAWRAGRFVLEKDSEGEARTDISGVRFQAADPHGEDLSKERQVRHDVGNLVDSVSKLRRLPGLEGVVLFRAPLKVEQPIRGPGTRTKFGLDCSPDGDESGFLARPVRAKEGHDSDLTVSERLPRIAELCDREGLSDRESLVKAIFQFQHSVDLDDAATDRILEPVLERIRDSTFVEKRVGSVEQVAAGAAVDLSSMWPLNGGTRARRALGVVLRDLEGGVLSKAKVWCG